MTSGHAVDCTDTGGECAIGCTAGSGVLCDLVDSPVFAAETLFCLEPESPLVDAGLDLGYDMVDGDDDTYQDTGPEIGARESGTMRRYGEQPHLCP